MAGADIVQFSEDGKGIATSESFAAAKACDQIAYTKEEPWGRVVCLQR